MPHFTGRERGGGRKEGAAMPRLTGRERGGERRAPAAKGGRGGRQALGHVVGVGGLL